MNNIEFGKKVTFLRKEKGLTQKQLAEILNVSDKAVSRWESGKGYPEVTILPKLASALGVSVDELLSSDEDAKEENYTQTVHAKKHNDVPLEKPYWRSLTIFNKIGVVTAILGIITIPCSLLMSINNTPINIYITMTTMLSSIVLFADKIGLAATIIGLIAGLLDLYDRQIKCSIVLIVYLLLFQNLLPILLFNMMV